MATLPRVRPRLDVRGVYIWTAIVGTISGLFFAIIQNAISASILPFVIGGVLPLILLRVVYFGLLLLITLPFALYFLNTCHRLYVSYLVGHCYGSSFILGGVLHMLLTGGPLLVQQVSFWEVFWMVFLGGSALAGGAFFGLGFLALRWITNVCFGPVIEQRTFLCWKCAHIIAHPPVSRRCQECGAPSVKPSASRSTASQIVAFGKRHSRIAGCLFLGLLVVGGVMKWLGTDPVLIEFVEGAGIGGAMGYGAGWEIEPGVTNPVPHCGWEAMVRFDPVKNDSTKTIGVYFRSQPKAGKPVMQIQLMASVPNQLYGVPGTPLILCDLDAVQAQRVTREGVPAALVEEMLQVARDNNWTPTLTPPGTISLFIVIDAAPFFPASGEDSRSDGEADKDE